MADKKAKTVKKAAVAEKAPKARKQVEPKVAPQAAYVALLKKLVQSNEANGAKSAASVKIRRQLRAMVNWKDRSPFPGRVELNNILGIEPKAKGKKEAPKAAAPKKAVKKVATPKKAKGE